MPSAGDTLTQPPCDSFVPHPLGCRETEGRQETPWSSQAGDSYGVSDISVTPQSPTGHTLDLHGFCVLTLFSAPAGVGCSLPWANIFPAG